MDLLRKGRKGQPEPPRPAFLRRRAARFFTVFAMLTLAVVTILYYLPTTFRISQRERVLKTAAACTPTALTDPFNRTKVALLIETRPKVSLVPILLHYMATTPPDWPFHVIHSAENAHILASRSLQQYITSGRLNTTLLAPGVILKDSQTVSEFLTSRWIWDQIQAEHILFFQLDAMLCSNSDQTIDDFLKFDWIGAPWPHRRQLRGGNGGFSMRRKSRMLRCIERQTWQRGGPNEDVWFSQCMATFSDAILPTYEESMSWAVEAQESKRYMGIHKPWGSVKVATHYDFCPEAAMLFLP
ncbi:hypothetical protein HDU89_006236 [Geranomyces variabilis]|nr:hypothetical protein HDU89_006236 [Geranomyces variabilis]